MTKSNGITRALFITARANSIPLADFTEWEKELADLELIVQLFLDPPEAK